MLTMVTASFAGGLLLAGCETRPDPAQFSDTLQAAPPAPPPAAVPAETRIVPATVREPRKPVLRPARPAAPRSVPPPDLPQLVGMDQRQLTDLLGPPDSESGASPGKHWIYHLHHCAFDLSLYPNVDTRSFRLLSYEVNDDDRTSDRKQHCQMELAERLRTRQSHARSD